jgi:hypothetical protein
MIKKVLIFLFSLLSVTLSAQEQPEMADAFRADGKINVVIGVLTLIFLAIVVFLVVLERKIKKLEDKLKK